MNGTTVLRRVKKWRETRDVLHHLATLVGAPAALATVVRVTGSAYRHEGAKLLVMADGDDVGNVSGGCLEQDVRQVALDVIATGRPQLRHYCSDSDEVAAWDLGVGCAGRVDVLIEPALEPRECERRLLDGRSPFVVCTAVPEPGAAGGGARLIATATTFEGDLGSAELNTRCLARGRALFGGEQSGLEAIAGRSVFFDLFVPPPEVLMCGAAEDAPALARAAAAVGFRVTLADWRTGYLVANRFPLAVRLVRSDGPELLDQVSIETGDYAIVMTHNFARDREYLRALLGTSVSYIGLLGPRERTERLLRDLNVGSEDEARVYGPVGLDIGTDGAEQIALATVAEMLAVRAGRPPLSLRVRRGSIHARGA